MARRRRPKPIEAADQPTKSQPSEDKPKSNPRTPVPVSSPSQELDPEKDKYCGSALKKLREDKGVSLQEISEATKISVATLMALEDERFDEMPNARVYVRGFVRCLAEELNLDKDEVSTSYLRQWQRWMNAQALT